MTTQKFAQISNKLALGTVQLGVSYGVSNRKGQVSEEEAHRILDTAVRSSVRTWDTARGYGTSEDVIGRWISSDGRETGASIRLISKVPKLARAGGAGEVEDEVVGHVKQSLSRLRVPVLDAVLFHHEDDLLGQSSEKAWKTLEKLKAEGKVNRLGVSAYSPEPLQAILQRFPVEVVQVPYNLLDRRFFSKELRALYSKANIEVHVRSVFLQGLFFMQESTLPPHMVFAKETLRRLRELADDAGCSLPEMALASAVDQPHIAKVVFGVTSADELSEILSWKYRPVPVAADAAAQGLWRLTQGRIIDPRSWVVKV